METRDYAVRAAKRLYHWRNGARYLNPECEMNRQTANDLIFSRLSASGPCMISRFGTVELNCVNNYRCIASEAPYLSKIVDYITGHTHTPWWNKAHFHALSEAAGVFPATEEMATILSQEYLKDSQLIDILGSFQYYERYMPLAPNVEKVQLETLYPFFVAQPWTRFLAGLRVLVVHPFDKTIASQFAKRQFLFPNTTVLPDFELLTLQAVQSAAGATTQYANWADALNAMKNKISDLQFDIAILGCGAYGLPLAAHIKRMGKKAVHLGGGTQLLFGIKGRRWEKQYSREWEYRPGEKINTNYVDLFNDSWVYPAASERPTLASKVEDACYW